MIGRANVVAMETGRESVESTESVEPASPESKVELRCLKLARREAVDRFEVEYIRALLKKAGGNVTRAAGLAQVSRQVIHKLIARHRL